MENNIFVRETYKKAEDIINSKKYGLGHNFVSGSRYIIDLEYDLWGEVISRTDKTVVIKSFLGTKRYKLKEVELPNGSVSEYVSGWYRGMYASDSERLVSQDKGRINIFEII